MIDSNIDREIDLVISAKYQQWFREVLKVVPSQVQRDAFERMKRELVQKKEI